MGVGVASSSESKTWILPAFSATKTLPSELNLTAVGTLSPDNSVTTSNPPWTGSPRVSTGAAAAGGDVDAEDEGSPMSPSPGACCLAAPVRSATAINTTIGPITMRLLNIPATPTIWML